MSDFEVRFGRTDGLPGFVFSRELTKAEAKAFHEEVGVWPIHTVDGVLKATYPKSEKKR